MSEERAIVVGAAIVRRGRVLAARRTGPPEAAGRWEFPGGKVEPDEGLDAALRREIAEELGCAVEVLGFAPDTVPIGERHRLAVGLARIVDGEPEPTEHDQLRWLGADELDDVDWLPPDRPFLPWVRGELLGEAAAGGARMILFDEDDAEVVVRRLRADGYQARVLRERLAGEDDDEDHPWAVVSDAPELVQELLVEEYDGWLDRETPGVGAEPLELPQAPRRVKRPGAPGEC